MVVLNNDIVGSQISKDVTVGYEESVWVDFFTPLVMRQVFKTWR